jgi:hypothetical protein
MIQKEALYPERDPMHVSSICAVVKPLLHQEIYYLAQEHVAVADHSWSGVGSTLSRNDFRQ